MLALRIAAPHFLNTLPFVDGLEKLSGLSIRRAAPSTIAGLITSGEVDLGLASIVDAPRHNLQVLDIDNIGMIGCHGPTLTVRLYSRVQLNTVTSLYADTDSHTSVILARLLLLQLYGVRPRVLPLQPSAPFPSDAQCVLLIGDKVMNAAPSPIDFPHQLDLGQAWRDVTKYPFVYAAWMCTQVSPRVRTAAGLIDRQIRHNLQRLDAIVNTNAPRAGWSITDATAYMRGLLQYDLTPQAKLGAEHFLNLAHAHGLLESPQLRWAK